MKALLMTLLLVCSSSVLAQERVSWITVKDDGFLCIKQGFLTLCARCASTSFTVNGVRYETSSSDWEYRVSPSDPWTKMSGESTSGKVCSLSSTPTRPGQYRPIVRLRIDGVLKTYTSSNVLTIVGDSSENESEEETEINDEADDETVVEAATWGQIKSSF